ncbi:MAG: hypothetical protein H7Y28_07785, partial [Rhodoferax sp.]|nr:hypothetical protein [Rhodoferax sp.]
MNTTKTSYPETIQFGARYVVAWSFAMVGCVLLVWTFTGYNDRMARVAWAFGTIGIAITVGV